MSRKYSIVKLVAKCLILIATIIGGVSCESRVNIKSTKSDAIQENSHIEWFKVADNLYQFRYKHHYTLFVTSSKGVIAFDPLSDEAAEHYISAIKTVAPGQPLIAIIYSHWHIDHSAGARILMREFGNNIPVIAHERTLARLKRWDDPAIILPNKLIGDEGKLLHFGDVDIDLNYLGYGHTNNMLVPLFPKQKLVFVVDFANNDAVGWRDLPGWYLGELVAMQERLNRLDFNTVAFAHGKPGDKSTILRQSEYFKKLMSLAKLAFEKGLSEDEAVKDIEPKMSDYKHWHSYDDWFTLNIRGAYRWVKN